MSRPTAPRIKHILCPVDYSTSSRRAFVHATALARLHGASITVLHVSEHLMKDVDVQAPGAVLVARPTRERVALDIKGFVAAWDNVALPIDVAAAEGPVADMIIREARARGADLVVMGRHGRFNLRYLALGALGSVTLEVVRNAPCPVLVVPPATPPDADAKYRHIVCPVDFGAASLRAVEYALALAQAGGATLVLLYVIDPSATQREREVYDTRPRPLDEAAARRALAALVPADAHDYCRVLELIATGTPHEEILRVAKGLQADVMVMGLGARSAAEMLLLGSTADPVLRSAPCPVLTVSAGPH